MDIIGYGVYNTKTKFILYFDTKEIAKLECIRMNRNEWICNRPVSYRIVAIGLAED